MQYAYDIYTKAIKQIPDRADMSLDEFQLALDCFWDEMQLDVVSAVSDTYLRNAYIILIRQAKTQCRTFGWLGEPEVFQSVTPKALEKSKKPWAGLASAGLLAGLVLWFTLPHSGRSLPIAVLCGAALALSLVQLLISWLTRPKPLAASPVHTRVEQQIVGQRVHSGLGQMVREMDSHAETLQAMLRESSVRTDGPDISLVQNLLRIPAGMRGSEVTDAINLYLARNSIEKVEYNGENSDLFMVMPAPNTGTVEPALIRDGKILCQGVACVKTEG